MLAKMLATSLLLILATGLRASGPYSPTRVDHQRDELYEAGKAIYWGQTKIGQGSTCADCHASKDTLNRARLAKIRQDLQGRVTNCVRLPDRTNGSIEDKQLEALVHYLAKRFHL